MHKKVKISDRSGVVRVPFSSSKDRGKLLKFIYFFFVVLHVKLQNCHGNVGVKKRFGA